MVVPDNIKKQVIERFKKEYPNAKLDKFDFGCNLNNNGSLKSTDIYYKVTPKYSDWIPITGNKFKNNPDYQKDLYGNHKERFPKI